VGGMVEEYVWKDLQEIEKQDELDSLKVIMG